VGKARESKIRASAPVPRPVPKGKQVKPNAKRSADQTPKTVQNGRAEKYSTYPRFAFDLLFAANSPALRSD